MRRRRHAALATLTLALFALPWPPAGAKDLGTDVIGNVSPKSQLAGSDSLADRHPLSAYTLDYDTDVGITELDGVPPTIAHYVAAQIWSVTSFLVKAVIDLFTWAFSLDLLQGDPSRPDDGALAPVAEAISSIYEHVFGEAWMVVAILLAGMWGIWKALVQRRYTETAGALALSVIFVVVALFFVHQPERTVGQASEWTNTMSLAFLSGANRGTVDDPERAKTEVADHLFKTLIYDPWVVLNFGGLRHCVDTGDKDGDGYPAPVSPHDPKADVCRDHLRQGRDGHGGYAERFLRQAPGSDARKAEFDALREGETPDIRDTDLAPAPTPGAAEPQGDLGTYGETPPDPRQFTGYEVDKTDSPAVDIQQEGGAFQRVTVAAIVFLGALGAVILLGFLSLAVILAQVLALVLLAFAPVALVIGIFPGRGHDFFKAWLSKLATAVFIKALYSLVIAIVLAVSTALVASTTELGFLFAFGIQTLFFWAIFIYRKQISTRLVAATTGEEGRERHVPRALAAYYGARAATQPMRSLLRTGGARGPERRARQPASATADPPGSYGPDGRGDGGGRSPNDLPPKSPKGNDGSPGGGMAAGSSRTRREGRTRGAGANGRRAKPSTNGAQRNGGDPTISLPRERQRDGNQTPAPADRAEAPHAQAATASPAAARRSGGELTPREAHEETVRRVRAGRERETTPTAAPPVTRPTEGKR